jgi:hypothetical protein
MRPPFPLRLLLVLRPLTGLVNIQPNLSVPIPSIKTMINPDALVGRRALAGTILGITIYTFW